MTTILKQTKRTGFLAGVGAAAALYVYSRTYVRHVTDEFAEQLPGGMPRPAAPPAQMPEPVFGAAARAWVVRRWNEGVDTAFTPVVQALARRNL